MENRDNIKLNVDVREISKSFPGVLALDNISLSIHRGEIHTIMGENGAGKSTLVKILAGIHSQDNGEIFIKGEKIKIRNEYHALQAGVSMVHQELNYFPDMTVAENIFAGREPSVWGILKRNELNHRAGSLLKEFKLELLPGQKMKSLSISECQLVEIVKAISCESEVLIMDEPTSAISSSDTDFLFQILQDLKKRGISVIYITHKMEEVFRISDRITVLRDGKLVSTRPVADFSSNDLIRNMVGRELNEIFPERDSLPGQKVLELRNLGRTSTFSDINFSLRKGEILGLAGLVGSGRTEILEAIFGSTPAEEGEIFIQDIQVDINSPKDAIRSGIALVPEDRKKSGLNLLGSVMFNASLSTLHHYSGKWGVISMKKEKKSVTDITQMLQVKSTNLRQLVGELSGGNQQKIVLAKWLLTNPGILLLDEPTRGIDIGAKTEIYILINKLVQEGISIIMVSSEMPELIGMCDRILGIRKARISGEFHRGEFHQEQIMKAIIN